VDFIVKTLLVNVLQTVFFLFFSIVLLSSSGMWVVGNFSVRIALDQWC